MHTKIGTNTGQNIEVNCTLKYDGDEIFSGEYFLIQIHVLYDILMSMAGLWLSRCIICFSPLIIETKIAHRFLDSQPIDLRDSFS